MDSARSIDEREVRHRGRAVVVANSEPDRDRRVHVEEDRQLATKAEVLGALADIEADRGFSFAGFAAVEQREGKFDPESTQALRHRLGRHHLDLKEAPGRSPADLAVFQMPLILSRHAQIGCPCRDRAGLRAGDSNRFGGRGLVDDLDDDRRKAGLLQHRRCWATTHFDSFFRIDRDDEKHVVIQEFLK